MSQSYKGLTIPSYTDTADAPNAFQDFTDSGPIPRFADGTARDAAIAVPLEGQMCYNTALGTFQYYDGASWTTPWIQQNEVEYVVDLGDAGILNTGIGIARWYPRWDVTVLDVAVSVGTAPTTQPIIVDVNKNGSTMFASSKPQIAAGANLGVSGAPSPNTLLGDTDYISIDIDQVGSGTAGSDLTVSIRYRRT